MRWIAVVSVLVVMTAACGMPDREYVPATFPESIAVAPLDEALTFARADMDGTLRVLAIGALAAEHAVAFDLTDELVSGSDDPIALFNALGYDALRERIELGLSEAPMEVKVSDLTIPVDLADAHIAAGTNFAAHAEESDVEDGPFLFAKMVTPTVFNGTVTAGDALLDYEVELAVVTLDAMPLPKVPEYMGVVLANDFTNRAALLRHLDPDNVISGDGFTTGKSAEGYLPVGNLFVIPRNLETFLDGIDLNLAVNGGLRQRANMKLAIWDIRELMRQIEARKDVRWDYAGGEVGLPIEDGVVPARTLILAGTPDGTVFNGIHRGAMIGGAGRWAAGGWGLSITDNVIESYIASASEAGVYLKPGDVVRIQVERMGVIETTVE